MSTYNVTMRIVGHKTIRVRAKNEDEARILADDRLNKRKTISLQIENIFDIEPVDTEED